MATVPTLRTPSTVSLLRRPVNLQRGKADRRQRIFCECFEEKLRDPFYFKALGQLCSIGGRRAVAEMLGFRISGFLAWFMWRSVYLFKLPTWSRRIKVGLDWFSDLIFPREFGTLRRARLNR